jgi:hypothetical protein
MMLAWGGGLYVEAGDGRRDAAEVARVLAEARDLLGHDEAARVVQGEGLKAFLDEWLVIPSKG